MFHIHVQWRHHATYRSLSLPASHDKCLLRGDAKLMQRHYVYLEADNRVPPQHGNSHAAC
jgi:hypothetical protein